MTVGNLSKIQYIAQGEGLKHISIVYLVPFFHRQLHPSDLSSNSSTRHKKQRTDEKWKPTWTMWCVAL